MSAPVLERDSVDEQLLSLTTLVQQLQREVRELRRENAELRCELGYWKSMHARAVERITKLQAELDQAKAENRQLKAERFGKQSEKQSAADRSNDLDDPREAGEETVVYVLDPSRSHDVPQSHFGKAVQGVLMVDRYIAYKIMRQVKEGKLLLAFCWAHVRRDFVRVGKGYPELTAWALTWLRRIRELYRLNRQRLRHPRETAEFADADAKLCRQVVAMAAQRDSELADDTLRDPCRKVLVSLNEHWSGLTLFVDDPRIPLDNNYGERLIRNPALGRKNYYGSGAEWSGRLAVMMFSIFATLAVWKINPRKWLRWYLDVCAAGGGKPPDDPASFLPWNLSETRLADLRSPTPSPSANDTS